MKLGTRGSRLALAQSGQVAQAMKAANEGLEIETVPITTAGDRSHESGDKSRYVKEIELALIAGEVDLAVHSAKDLPGVEVDGLEIVATPQRADARDLFIGEAGSTDEIREGSRIGTSSIRRKAQLKAIRPDLVVGDLHGNVDTRLRRQLDGDFDGIVLAVAGLERLGLDYGAGFVFEIEDLVPAPGQGALVVQIRETDEDIRQLAVKIGDRESHICLRAERAVARELGATCNTPLGVHAAICDSVLTVSAFAGTDDGNRWIRDQVTGDPSDPDSLGKRCAKRLVAAGAIEMLQITSDKGSAQK